MFQKAANKMFGGTQKMQSFTMRGSDSVHAFKRKGCVGFMQQHSGCDTVALSSEVEEARTKRRKMCT